MKKILWIEDDYLRLKGLVRPLEKSGFIIEYCTDYTSFLKKNTSDIDLYIVDLLLPQKEEGAIVSEEEFIDITGMKVINEIIKTDKPIVVFTVVENTVILSELRSMKNIKAILSKGEIYPSDFKNDIMKILEIGNDN
jgi:DNA-binding response OmpR family regulator